MIFSFRKKPLGYFKNQTGIVLITSMLLLLLISLIVISSVQITSLEEKMAGNSKDQNIAFQFAEMALRTGEARIVTIRTAGNPGIKSFCNNTPGLFKSPSITAGGVCTTAVPDANNASTWTSDNSSIALNTNSPLIAKEPRYFITYITYRAALSPNTPPTHGFIITARGTGAQSNTHVILRSYYGGAVSFP